MINIKCKKPGTNQMRAQKFQNGTRLTINSLIGLQRYMECKHGVPYLMCSHCDQDYLESFNGQMRNADGKGGIRRPTFLQLNYRIKTQSFHFTDFCQTLYTMG